MRLYEDGYFRHTIIYFLYAREKKIVSFCMVHLNASVAHSSSIVRLPMLTRIEARFVITSEHNQELSIERLCSTSLKRSRPWLRRSWDSKLPKSLFPAAWDPWTILKTHMLLRMKGPARLSILWSEFLTPSACTNSYKKSSSLTASVSPAPSPSIPPSTHAPRSVLSNVFRQMGLPGTFLDQSSFACQTPS